MVVADGEGAEGVEDRVDNDAGSAYSSSYLRCLANYTSAADLVRRLDGCMASERISGSGHRGRRAV
jgi:hypothetical protein